ncbi:MAG: hypothetical protein IPM64_00255 [Phycisphaerales bacterium]|nr:hypothetical protein [Phycisphaerales bacterium]
MSDRPANPTAADGQRSLRDHIREKALSARTKFAGRIDRAAIFRLLEDRSLVRYPVGVRFDSEPLRRGEFACLEALGAHPSGGFCLFVHPLFEPVDEMLPLLIAYFIPSVNYGDVTTHVEAELFGSVLLGLDREEYYRLLCSASDSV